MASIAVIFESRYGQSEKIAIHVAGLAERHGHAARLVHASLATRTSVDGHDGVVIVAPVYFGKHAPAVERFLRLHRDALVKRTCAFVSVSNSAASPSPKARTKALRIAHAILDDAAWQPATVITAGGALAYPHYGFFLKLMMRFIARQSGAPGDTSRVHELTDWAALDRDLAPFFAMGGLAPPQPIAVEREAEDGRSGIRRLSPTSKPTAASRRG